MTKPPFAGWIIEASCDRAFVLPRLRPGTSTSAAPAPRSSTGSTRAGTAARSCSASRTPTSSARPPTWSRESSTVCAGWGSTGTRAPAPAVRTVPISSQSGSIATGMRRRSSSPAASPITATARRSACARSATTRNSAARRGNTIAHVLRSPPGRSRSSRRWARRAQSGSRSGGTATAFDDAVHGRIEFDPKNIEDFVILRSDQHPTYHLSVVVDDVDMAITHVIRGDDHISNTPKHLMLFDALGAAAPVFAHVPLILGADKKRLSKRHGATSVTEYRRQGYLPDAMVNFLALLGWSPGDDRELMSIAELTGSFSLGGISGGNAVFNTEKLDWMNGQYIARLSERGAAARGGAAARRRGAARSRRAAGGCLALSTHRSAASPGEAHGRFRGARPPLPGGYG